MWNFDKIQPSLSHFLHTFSCGLMWNFDKIQLIQLYKSTRHVVV